VGRAVGNSPCGGENRIPGRSLQGCPARTRPQWSTEKFQMDPDSKPPPPERRQGHAKTRPCLFPRHGDLLGADGTRVRLRRDPWPCLCLRRARQPDPVDNTCLCTRELSHPPSLRITGDAPYLGTKSTYPYDLPRRDLRQQRSGQRDRPAGDVHVAIRCTKKVALKVVHTAPTATITWCIANRK
jgi:hypothetical protein